MRRGTVYTRVDGTGEFQVCRSRTQAHCSLIVASELNPMSVLARLTPYVQGSGTITVYSLHQQVLAETLQWVKSDPNYTHQTLSESWTRTYQVLPGRTHPMMTTSATGGYLLHAIRV
jgi:tRNA (adenine-N(1)-)-methyltransferase non-catalytic subunit